MTIISIALLDMRRPQDWMLLLMIQESLSDEAETDMTDAEYETDTNEEHEAEEFVAKNSIEGKNFLDHLTNYFNIHCKK